MAADPRLHLSRSWTTRPQRPSEPDDAYVFVDRESFIAHRDAGGFLEWNEFAGNGHLYGTPVPDESDPRDLVLEIDVNGAEWVRRRRPDALVVLLLPPSLTELEGRLRSRGDPEEPLRARLALAAEEEERGRTVADAVVVNDDLDRAVAEVAAIVAGRRDGPPSGEIPC